MPSIAQLRYILAVHRYGHFGRAAEACHVSQPTLSGQIQRAEEQLGITIFVRENKPVTATEKGYALIEQAQVVVAAHERLVRMAKGQFEKVAGDLTLGIIPTLAPYVMPWFLKAFADQYTMVNLSVVERTTDEITADLLRSRLDVGLLATPLHEERLEERVLFYDPFYLYAHADDPILRSDEVDPELIEAEKLWLLEDGHCVRNQTLALCDLVEGCSHLSTVRFEAGSFETIRNLIDASEGYTLIPETYARLLPRERRRARVRALGEPTPTREVSLVHARSTYKTDLLDALDRTIRASIPRSLQRPPDRLDILPVDRPAGEPAKNRRTSSKKRKRVG